MTTQTHTADDSTEVRFDLTGHVRTMVEQFAQCPFDGSEDAENALDRFSTRVAIRSVEEAEAVKSIIRQVRDENELQASQERALRRAAANAEEAKAHFMFAEDDAEDEESEVVADGGVPETAETKQEAAALIESLEEGDEVEVAGRGKRETYRVISTDGDWFTGKRTDGFKQGTTTFKPSGFKHFCLTTQSRGMGAHFSTIEVVAPEAEEDEDEDDEDDDEKEVATDGGRDVDGWGDAEENAPDVDGEVDTYVLGAGTVDTDDIPSADTVREADRAVVGYRSSRTREMTEITIDIDAERVEPTVTDTCYWFQGTPEERDADTYECDWGTVGGLTERDNYYKVGNVRYVHLITEAEEERTCDRDGCDAPAQERSSYCSQECGDEARGYTVAELVDPDADPYDDEDEPEVMTDGGRVEEEEDDGVDPRDYDALDGISSTERLDEAHIGQQVSTSYNTTDHIYSVYGVLTHPYEVEEGDDVLVQYGERTASGGFRYHAYQQSAVGTITHLTDDGFTVEVADADRRVVVQFPVEDGVDGAESEVVFPGAEESYGLKALVKVEEASDSFAGDLVEGNTAPIVVGFKTGEESEFQKPDHDPHGETCAAAAHSSTSCDECGKSGLVPTMALDVAAGMDRAFERPVICSECGGD